MDYDETILSELALKLLEGDIKYVCSRYHVPGYDHEDLEQECRLKLWQSLGKFDSDRGVLVRTWASRVIKNHLKNLLRDATREVRKANFSVVYVLVEELLNENGNYYVIREDQEENEC